MNSFTFSRYIAVFIGVTTLFFLFLHGSFRSDNIFLVPDLILSALLLVAAALPKRIAAVMLLFGFGLAVGVFVTATVSSMIQGQMGIPTLVAAIGSLAISIILMRRMIGKNHSKDNGR